MKNKHTILLSFTLLFTSCSDCSDAPQEPSAKIEDICPAEPLPPQDCYIPGSNPMPGTSDETFTIRKIKDFERICNSPCTKIGSVGIYLEEKLDTPMPMGNVDYIGRLSFIPEVKQDLNGLNSISKIDQLTINTKLEKISDLDSLKEIITLTIRDNENLTVATKPLLVEDMMQVGSSINISNNPKLKDLKLLSNLKRASYIVLLGNGDQSFETLDGLNNLEEVESLVIGGNRNLKSLRALSKLKKVTNLLIIENHGKLPQCEIDWFLGNLDVVTDDVRISNNSSVAPDCAQ
jgi:hypothetical protein